jgi:hypothetical protein
MGTSGTVVREKLAPKGMLELFVTKGKPRLVLSNPIANSHNAPLYGDHEIDFSGCELLDTVKQENIIVNQGKDLVIQSLAPGGYIRSLARLAVGDNGALPSDSQVPKIPEPTMAELYNEIGRADADATILNIGTPSVHEVKLVKTFVAADFPITAFSNQAKPMLNEVGLLIVNLAAAPLPRTPLYAPYGGSNVPLADEMLFAIRTHKSVPFEASNDISVTIRYTIYIE